jgi:hypothetical protein
MPRITKTCPACGERNVIPVGTDKPPEAVEYRCRCGLVLFDYRERFNPKDYGFGD